MGKAASIKIILFISCISVFLLAVFSIFTADDSYILLRYVKNFIDHGEISFNLTEKVSALTSPLHFLVMVVIGWFSGTYILHAGKIVMCLLLFVSTYLTAKTYRNQPLVFLLPLAALLLSPFVIMWTIGGLETILLLFIITWLCVLSLAPASASALYKMCLVAGLAFLTRYDSVLFTAPFLFVFYLLRFNFIKDIKKAFFAVILYAAIPTAWLLFSLFYFRDILPTSFYAKISHTLNVGTIIYCFQFLAYSSFLPFYLFGLIFTVLNKQNQIILHLKQYLHFYVSLGVILIYGFANAQVHMLFGYRLLLPYTTAFLLLALNLVNSALAYQLKAVFRKRIYVTLLILFGTSQLLHSAYVYYKSLNGFTLSGEYQHTGIYDYKHEFLRVFEEGAKDIQAHMKTQPKFKSRPPSLLTFAEGLIPYRIPDIYVYGPLISMRRNDVDFSSAFARYSDYSYIIAQYANNVFDSLSAIPQQYVLISNKQVDVNGTNIGFYIFYNKTPEQYVLTKYVRNHPRDFFQRLGKGL